MMEGAGLQVEVTGLGADAIKKIQAVAAGEAKKPDLILLDLILADMNGVEVLKEVRQHDTTKHIAVFILTNQTKEELQNMGDVRPDKFLIKANIAPTQLLDLVKKQLA